MRNLKLKEEARPEPAEVVELQGVAKERPRVTAATVISAVACIAYAYLYWKGLAPYWFHPDWATDDSLQQVYPFHKVSNPALFAGDIITKMMETYLAPIHYWLCYGVTWLTGDAIMMGHWIMLAQISLSIGFLFFAVSHLAGVVPAFFAVTWLVHTRHVMQRITGGLPRGWAAAVLLAYLCFAIRGRHRAVLVTLLVGCLLHPPATLVAALAYGLTLLWGVADPSTRAAYRKPLLTYICLSPLYVAITLTVLRTPPEIGTMASYETASSMPEFLRPRGRFPFVPLKPASEEIRAFGFQAFVTRFYSAPPILKRYMPEIAVGMLLGMLALGALRRRRTVPKEILLFGAASLCVYFASRLLAFKLYVPDRHLQFPMSIFTILAFTCGMWRLFHRDPKRYGDSSLRVAWPGIAGLVALGGLIFAAGGTGLYGSANFNYSTTKRGNVFIWIRGNTPEDAVIASHPTYIDGLQLFGKRKAYITTETAHPFYDKYYATIKPRIETSLRAFYARTLEELVSLCEAEGIDYFVFGRRYFYPRSLETAYYQAPFDTLVKELTSRPDDEYAYRGLPTTFDPEKYPFVVFRDSMSVVVDIKRLKEYLENA